MKFNHIECKWGTLYLATQSGDDDYYSENN